MKKRFFAALLSFIMVFSLLPVNALAGSKSVDITVRVFVPSTGAYYTVGTDTAGAGKPGQIQSADYKIPPLTKFVDSGKFGRVTGVYGNWYFPSTTNQQPGVTVQWSTNSGTGTMTYWVDWYKPGGGSSTNYLWNFTLKYDANGGTGAPADQTWGTNDKYTKSHTFNIPSTVPTREGYVFKGWSDTKGGSATRQPGGTCLVSQTVSGYNGGSVTKTLYAVWEEETPPTDFTFILKFDANGGAGTFADVTKTSNAQYEMLQIPTSYAPTRTGYDFMGWKDTYHGTIYQPGGSVNVNRTDTPACVVTDSSCTKTLYAAWKIDWSGLTITKQASPSKAKPGKQITYTITVRNNTEKDLTNVTVSDTLPDTLTFVSADPSGQYDATTGVWTIPSLSSGSSATLTITATVKNTVTDGTKISNIATITGATSEDGEELPDSDKKGSADVTVEVPKQEPEAAVLGKAELDKLFQKELTVNEAMAEGESFTVLIKDKEGTKIASGETVKMSETATKPFVFEENASLTFAAEGTYSYIVTEKAGSTDKMTYDSASYTMTVTVADKGGDQLKITGISFTDAQDESVNEVVFHNTYGKQQTEKFPVNIVIYRNGDTSKAYKTVSLGEQSKGTVIDLSTLKIANYYTANYTGKYDFYGWYNDGTWNGYKANPDNPPAGLEKITVNGWTNIICMVYDYEKVVYFQSAEDLAAYQKDHSKTEGLLGTDVVRKGTELPTADAPAAERTGYTFKFWSREGQNGDVTGQTVNGWTNLYANWEKTEYTISYDLRDGKAENSSENPTTYTVEDAIELKAPTTKRDNKFLEWRDEDDNVVTEIKKGTTGNIKLYAYWKCPIKLYEVTDTGEKVQLGETIYLPEGTTYPLPEGTEYARIGYSFNCWFASEKDLNAEKNRKSEVTTSVEKEWKLYGKNVPIEYTITYDYRDKDVTEKTWLQPANKTGYTVETETFRINPVTEKGEFGKVFLEWRDEDGKVVTEIKKGTTGNITLYAYWKYPVNYTLKRLDKDGKAVETTKDTDLFIEDDFGEFKLKSVSRDGYTFSGWYEFENLTGACTAITTPKKYELYGTLTPNTNTAYTVEHYLENLDGSYPTDASYTEPLTGTTDTFVTAKAQDHTGFTYSDSASERTKSGYIAGDGTLVLKLYYTRNSYNVNFYVDGTKADDMTKSVKYQGKVAEPTMDIKTGYAFDGWYTDATYTAAYKFDETQVTNNLDLYGRYIANTYTVKFDGNGATSGTMANQTFTYDVAQKLTKNAFAKTGYTFVGWKDGSDNTYTDEQEVMNLIAVQGGVVILTAQWTADPIAVDISQYVYKQYVQEYNRKDTTTFTFTAEVYPKAEISSGSGSAVVLANPLIDTVKGEVKIDSSKNGEVKQVTFEKTDKLSAGRYYVYITENKGTNSYITYDNSGYVLNIRVFDNERTGLEVKLIDIDKVTENGQMETTGGNTVTFVNTYTRASRPSTSSTSKPTLNTGDHFAYVMGYPDGTVRPNGSITRAEVSTILFRLLSDKTREEYFTTESSFTDVKAGAWYNNSIATLEKAGVIVDTAKGGAFRPNEAITRAELAAMLAQFADAKPVKGVKFTDVSADHWAYDAIAIAAKMGWIEGYPDGTFRPDATITRAEMMTLVNRALERVPSDEDHLLAKRAMLTFPDCTPRDWFYIAVQEATNSHAYERAATEKNGDEQWSKLISNPDWTKFEQ